MPRRAALRRAQETHRIPRRNGTGQVAAGGTANRGELPIRHRGPLAERGIAQQDDTERIRRAPAWNLPADGVTLPGTTGYLEDVGAVVRELSGLGLTPVLVGGMALVILGSRRVTRDFDFVIAKPDDRLEVLLLIE